MRTSTFLPGFTAEKSLEGQSLVRASVCQTALPRQPEILPWGDDKYCPPGHCEIDCGIFGPSHAETNCGPGQRGHCWCGSGGLGWGQGFCECQPGSPPPPPETTTCSIPSSPYSCWFGGAGVSGTDPGCTATCEGIYMPQCRPWSCDGTQWTQSSCGCVNPLHGTGVVIRPITVTTPPPPSA